MHRRRFIQTAGLTLGASRLPPPPPARAGQFTGRIRKPLKWGMA